MKDERNDHAEGRCPGNWALTFIPADHPMATEASKLMCERMDEIAKGDDEAAIEESLQALKILYTMGELPSKMMETGNRLAKRLTQLQSKEIFAKIEEAGLTGPVADAAKALIQALSAADEPADLDEEDVLAAVKEMLGE